MEPSPKKRYNDVTLNGHQILLVSLAFRYEKPKKTSRGPRFGNCHLDAAIGGCSLAFGKPAFRNDSGAIQQRLSPPERRHQCFCVCVSGFSKLRFKQWNMSRSSDRKLCDQDPPSPISNDPSPNIPANYG